MSGFNCLSILSFTITFFLISCVVVMILGKIMRGNVWAFFVEQVDHFAADDITALTLGVHKALLSAVDKVGLKSSLLRAKEHFAAGSNKRII